MKIKYWEYECLENGKCLDGGSVETEPMIKMSRGEGCSLSNCHCSEGYWIMINEGLKNGKVRGMTAFFDDQEEFHLFLATHKTVALKKNDLPFWAFESP